VEEELRATYLFQRNWSLHPAIQTEIAKVVVDQLQAKLSPMGKAQTERRPMENSEALSGVFAGQEFHVRANRQSVQRFS